MILTRDQQRAIHQAARTAVLNQAAKPLPEGAGFRRAEGFRRKRLAVIELQAQAKDAGPPCSCSPEQALSAIEAAKLVIQTVYDLLRQFGVINSSGAAS